MRSSRFYISFVLALALFMATGSLLSAKTSYKRPKTNKLLHMYRLYYLPFSVYFREGANQNEIVPFVNSDAAGLTKRMLKAGELQLLNSEWDKLRDSWKKKSLFLSTNVPLNGSVKISRSLMTHKISLSRRAFDRISLDDRIKLSEALKSKPPKIQKAFKQLRFLKSFLTKRHENQFNFFIFSADWCQSCLEYRALLEAFVKKFPKSNLTLHSVVIADPKEAIFDSQVFKELFPSPKEYSHESIPRFLSLETVNGKPILNAEGDALKIFYDRFLKKKRGYMDAKATLFKGKRKKPATRHLSSTTK